MFDEELDESVFRIDNDKVADWAIRKLSEETEETERLKAIADAQISEMQERKKQLDEQLAHKTGFLKSKLLEYFDMVPHKETKTQETYKLLSGSLVKKKASMSFVHDDEKLLEYFQKNAMTEYIKTKYSPDWATFKKELEITSDGKIINETTGEVVECVTLEEKPASFDIKF